MLFNFEGAILHIHTSAAVTIKVQYTLQIEALLRGTSVMVGVVQESAGAAFSLSQYHIIDPQQSHEAHHIKSDRLFVWWS